MNGKERALTAFAHQEADRVPIFELTIDNPTAEYVLGRSNLCGFGGKARGLAYNNAILNGSVQEYFLQRKLDEMELWEKLDLDVYPHCDPAAPGGGFLISSSNSIHPGVKPEYYLAMLETARKMGTYPIQSGGS